MSRSNVILVQRHVSSSVEDQVLRNFGLKDLDSWLLDGEICHLNIKSVEVNGPEIVSDVAGKSLFTDLVKSTLAWNGTTLVELSIKVIKVNYGSCIVHE